MSTDFYKKLSSHRRALLEEEQIFENNVRWPSPLWFSQTGFFSSIFHLIMLVRKNERGRRLNLKGKVNEEKERETEKREREDGGGGGGCGEGKQWEKY